GVTFCEIVGPTAKRLHFQGGWATPYPGFLLVQGRGLLPGRKRSATPEHLLTFAGTPAMARTTPRIPPEEWARARRGIGRPLHKKVPLCAQRSSETRVLRRNTRKKFLTRRQPGSRPAERSVP